MIKRESLPYLLIYEENESEDGIPFMYHAPFQIVRVHKEAIVLQELQHRKYCLMVCSVSKPSARMLTLASKQARYSGPGIVFLVDEESYIALKNTDAAEGIFLMHRSISEQDLTEILENLLRISRAYRKLSTSVNAQKEEINDLKIVQRAKLLLMSHLNMSEEQAHRYIEKRAMDTGSKRREIAESIIHTYDI